MSPMRHGNGEEHRLFFPLAMGIGLAIVVPLAKVFDPGGQAMFGLTMGGAIVGMLIAIAILGPRTPPRQR